MPSLLKAEHFQKGFPNPLMKCYYQGLPLFAENTGNGQIQENIKMSENLKEFGLTC